MAPPVGGGDKPEPAKPAHDPAKLREQMELLLDMLQAAPDSANAPVWRQKVAELKDALGPDAPRPEAKAESKPVDMTGWSEPKKAAVALHQEYQSLDHLDKKAVGAFKIRLRALARKTPEDDEGAVSVLDILATKVFGADYDPKVADLQFGSKSGSSRGQVGTARPKSDPYLGHAKWVTMRDASYNLLDQAAYIERYGADLRGDADDDVRRAINLTAQAIHHMARTGRMPTDLGLAAKKLTGASARRFLATVAKRAGLGSVQDHMDAVTKELKKVAGKARRVVSIKATASPEKSQPASATKTLAARDVSFQAIKDMIGNSLGLHEWPVDNGGRVKAEVKVTSRGGLVKTKYLHVTIIQPSGKWEYYREQPSGNFKMVESGR